MKQKNIDLALLLLRVSIGGLMLFHGFAKVLHGIDFIKGQIGVLAYAVYIGEVLAPLAILLGFRTRIAAAIYVVNCVVAVLMAHMSDLFTISDHGGYALELLALYLLGALALVFSGAGKYAVSAKNAWD